MMHACNWKCKKIVHKGAETLKKIALRYSLIANLELKQRKNGPRSICATGRLQSPFCMPPAHFYTEPNDGNVIPLQLYVLQIWLRANTTQSPLSAIYLIYRTVMQHNGAIFPPWIGIVKVDIDSNKITVPPTI